MIAAAALARAQRAAERLMTDTCVIRRQVGEHVGPGGVVTPQYAQIYAGKCRVQQRAGTARESEPGEAHLLLLRLELHLPVSATGVDAEDRATVTASATDPALVGREFAVRELAHKTLASARRFGVTEVTG